MKISYKKLWKLLIDLNLKKKDLAKLAGLSEYTIGKLTREENVNVESLAKICAALHCTMDDIMEIFVEGVDSND